MKLNTKRIKKISTIPSLVSRPVKIGNQKKVMEVATKGIYSHPIRTAVQEHISNAKDSHDAAGVSLSKIEITCPTLSSLELKIKDCGLGMSEEEVFENYIQLGVSTKDTSNDFLGAFGYGALSWFAVNDSAFSLIAIKNGVKCHFLITKDDVEFAKVDLLSREKTKEPNGVELTLPITKKEDIKKVEKAIHRSLRFWKEKPILKNMKAETLVPEFFGENGIIYQHSKNPSLKDYPAFMISFGGIEYSLDVSTLKEIEEEGILYDSWNHRRKPYTVVLNVSLGEIEVPSDRERILVNEKSLKMLKNRLKALKKETDKKIQADIKKDWSRVAFWGESHDLYQTEDFSVYKKDGIEVFARVSGKKLSYKTSNILTVYRYYKNERGHLEQHRWQLDKFFVGAEEEDLSFFINDEGLTSTSYKKRLKTLSQRNYYLIENQRPFNEKQMKFMKSQGFSFTKISTIKEPKVSRATQGRSLINALSSKGYDKNIIRLKDVNPCKMTIIPEFLFQKHKQACRFFMSNFDKIAVVKEKDLFLLKEAKQIKEEQVLNFFKSKKLKNDYNFSLAHEKLNEKEQKIFKSFNVIENFENITLLDELSLEQLQEISFAKKDPKEVSKYSKEIKKAIKAKNDEIEEAIVDNLAYKILTANNCSLPVYEWFRYNEMNEKTFESLKTTRLVMILEHCYYYFTEGQEFSAFTEYATKKQKTQAKKIVKSLEQQFLKMKRSRSDTLEFVLDFITRETNQDGSVSKRKVKEINDLLTILDKA